MAQADIPVVTVDRLPWSQTDIAEFDRLVAERNMFKINEDLAKRCREDCDQRITAMILMAGALKIQSHITNAEGKPMVAQLVTSKSADKLDPRLLLEQGVSASVVASATVKGKEYSYILVK